MPVSRFQFHFSATLLCAAFAASVAAQQPSGAQEPIVRPNTAARAASQLPWRHLSGLEVLRLNGKTLIVSRGSAVDNAGSGWIHVVRPFRLQIDKLGEGGRDDVATPEDIRRKTIALTSDPAAPNGFRASRAGVPAEGWYHIVYMADPQTGESSAMLTRQISSTRTDRPGDARVPSRFSLRRHAPVAYYYDSKTGFRPMVCYGWPMPMCVYTSAGIQSSFAVVEEMVAPEWTVIQLEKFMPDTARIIRLQAIVTGVSSGGAAWARTLAHRPGSVLMGTVRSPGDRQTLIFEIATNSRETIAIKTDPGVKVSLYAVGFAMAQTF